MLHFRLSRRDFIFISKIFPKSNGTHKGGTYGNQSYALRFVVTYRYITTCSSDYWLETVVELFLILFLFYYNHPLVHISTSFVFISDLTMCFFYVLHHFFYYNHSQFTLAPLSSTSYISDLSLCCMMCYPSSIVFSLTFPIQALSQPRFIGVSLSPITLVFSILRPSTHSRSNLLD